MWVGQYDLLLRFANCEQPCKIRATQPVLVCEKCTPKWTDPALPIVGRTSEMCIICLHVCAYAHSDALCANLNCVQKGQLVLIVAMHVHRRLLRSRNDRWTSTATFSCRLIKTTEQLWCISNIACPGILQTSWSLSHEMFFLRMLCWLSCDGGSYCLIIIIQCGGKAI